jgi:endonuclease/exonuclease/phosphatase family metal-dependent hydrolase
MIMADLRVVSYNLLHGIDLAAGGVVDVGRAARVLAALDADVVALQEVDRGQDRSGGVDQVAELAEALGMTGVFCPALLGSPDSAWRPALTDDGGAAYGVGLLVRQRLVGTRHVVLPGGGAGTRRSRLSTTSTRPPGRLRWARELGWDREPRVALIATVGDGTQQLTVIVTHLSYLPVRAVRQLRVLAGIATGNGPRLVIGDLNLPAWAVRFAMPSAQHAGGAPTFPSWRPRVQMHHVLVEGPVDVVHATAHPDTTSDHRPLVVDLRHR